MRAPILLAAAMLSCHPPQSPRPQPLPQRATPTPPATPVTETEASLDALREGGKVRGFTSVARYVDATGKPIGARFVHDATGFTFDYLRIESAPQGYIWVNSFPTSDKGEPHTQEHLLLGKGDRGRKFASFEAMALAQSSAFTAQWRTAYHFHTVAGHDEFWPVFEDQLDTLLHPDYSDEEIRREVRNFGVDKGDDGKLHLEEKGTVYNEMVRAYESPDTVLWREAGQLVYGATHPLALDSGGYPPAIREMTPADIRKFHDAAYHLPNMGMIAAFPSDMSLATVLDHVAAILMKEEPTPTGKAHTEADLPKPQPAQAGSIRIAAYPYGNATNPGPLALAWPASRVLDPGQRTLLALFLDAVAGDESTPLYKQLVDSKTRKVDLGASAVWSVVSSDQGEPVFVGLSGVKADKLDKPTVEQVRALVVGELKRIAQLPPGDPELAALDARVQSRVVDLRRRLSKLLDTPPGFGFRGTSSAWSDFLVDLARIPGFDKSLTMAPQLTAIDQFLAQTGKNRWADRIAAWGLLDEPFGIAAKPSPEVRAWLDDNRKKRIDDELAKLEDKYGAKDPQAALAAYAKDYDAATKQLEASAKAVELPPLVASPPMSLDDGLKYETGEVAGVRSFAAAFDTMASARVSLAFDVKGAAPADDQFLLAALPSLMSDAGVIENGKPIAADEMRERLRREVLELSVYYTTNLRTHRVELVVAGAGNGAGETKAALAWMRRAMLDADWRVDNLPRLRDLVDQRITELRQRMLGAEEGWVDDPRDAWWEQQTSEYLHAASFLTQLHDLHRLRWMLADPGDAMARTAAAKWLGSLADARTLPRADLAALGKALATDDAKPAAKIARWVTAAHALPEPANKLARDAGKDLQALLADLPDGSLAGDWAYLCREMAHDLDAGAPAVLERLAKLRGKLIVAERARIVEVASTANRGALAADVEQLVHALPAGHAAKPAPGTAVLDARLAQRVGALKKPLQLGLVDPSTSSGVFVNFAPATSYTADSDDALLDYLASNLYTGHGAHSIFMKTWAAGLAYSNGLHPRPAEAAIDYYAERCPLLPQTLRFVIGELEKAQPDANIARYALATAFSSRVANGYESRAAAMAADLVDGITPDVIRAFRSHLLELAKRANLANDLFARMPKVYGKVLPGLGKPAPDALYFVIGPEKQLAAYEDYLHAAVGKDQKLVRLYPRDFWIPLKL